MRCRHFILLGWLAFGLASSVAFASDLEQELGRAEVRIRSAAYPLLAGRTVEQIALLRRLDRLGYRRVRKRPENVGEFFFGHDAFWIYRHAHRWRGRDYPPSLVGLELRRSDGMILGGLSQGGSSHRLDREGLLWLEPELIAESIEADRARRVQIDLSTLPVHIWQVVLAAEDARFFEHSGVDARSLARAALANLKKGGVAQGGSTLTQQLVKNRDLSPKRTLGRKASEALRSLLLEAEYDKGEILEAYLNQVYLGHVDGLAIHGFGAAAAAYFSKSADQLSLAEAALLAGMIQGPNRLSPIRHAERAIGRRDWVLSRMSELGWAEPETIRLAKSAKPALRVSPPKATTPKHFTSWIAEIVRQRAGGWVDKGRGVVVESTLDPHLQELAEESVRDGLDRLRRSHARLRSEPLSAAMVVLDADSGDVLAYVGGDPAAGRVDRFDRARQARRQPGSTVKPLVLLEAFESCGSRDPLNAATRVADEPLRLEQGEQDWMPENYDREFRGVIDVRQALVDSRNVPFVRLGRWCGFAAVGEMFRRTGLTLSPEVPPSFVLGAMEATPLQIARAYSVFSTPGVRLEPQPVRRIERPGGRAIASLKPQRKRVVRSATAYLVQDLMKSVVNDGTARSVAIEGVEVFAKTGSSSDLRDAWLAGHAGSVVTVVWVGLDRGALGLTGSSAAGPIWKRFMERAVAERAPRSAVVPADIVERFVDPSTGLLVRSFAGGARRELFRRDALPRRDRFWRADRPAPCIR